MEPTTASEIKLARVQASTSGKCYLELHNFSSVVDVNVMIGKVMLKCSIDMLWIEHINVK